MKKLKHLFATIGLIAAGVALVSLMGLVLFYQPKPTPQAQRLAQQQWVKNDLLIQSLGRYLEVYQQLTQQRDKDALALAYVTRITQDLMMFPAKDNTSIRVVLPQQTQTKTAATIMVLREIHLGSTDNGLLQAFQQYNQLKHHLLEPYDTKTMSLLVYVLTGKGDVNQLININ